MASRPRPPTRAVAPRAHEPPTPPVSAKAVADIPWDHWRTLLAVLETGSLSAAARALDLTQPTAGRHVAALERALGTPLFVRAPTGLQATDAALALREPARGMASLAAALARTAASPEDAPVGVVRIAASEVIGIEVLPPVLTDLRERHPGLVIELSLSSRMEDLLRREADVAVRMTPPTQAQLVARRIGAIELGLHAHPDYLARHPAPRRLADVAAHAVIGYDTITPFLRQQRFQGRGLSRDAFALRSDSDVAQLALLRAGAGLGVCQVPIGRRDGLVRLLPRDIAWRLETWVTMHEDLRHSARCRVVFEALVEGLARYLTGG